MATETRDRFFPDPYLFDINASVRSDAESLDANSSKPLIFPSSISLTKDPGGLTGLFGASLCRLA